MVDTLKTSIVIGATAITGLNLYLNGDGVSITALFALYGVLLGNAVTSVVNNAKTSKEG